jgi:hypothetical protein
MFTIQFKQPYNNGIYTQFNKDFSTKPKRYYATNYNLSSFNCNQTHSDRNFRPKRIDISKDGEVNTPNKHQNNLFKTYSSSNRFFLTHKKLKKFMKPNKNDLSQTCKNKKNISIKIINDYFKPKTERIFKKKHESIRNNFRRKMNNSNDYNKTNSSNNNLSYYFPNLFNVNNNKIFSPEKYFNKSKFLFKNLNEYNFNEEIKNLSLINKNDKNYFSSKIKNNDSEIKEPLFIEKIYTFDILKNVRFKFKDSIEKSKYRTYINSFSKAINLKFNNDKRD